VCYEYGHGVKKDLNKALEYYRRAAEAGNVLSQKRMADFYYYGQLVKQDFKAAFEWYKKAAAQQNSERQGGRRGLRTSGDLLPRGEYERQ
jgi:TPR repeat protein